MCAAKTRVELWIDVFDQTEQRALARADLMPAEFIAAILAEFQQIEFLSQDENDYQLVRPPENHELDPSIQIGRQLMDNERLTLQEKQRPLPGHAKRPSRPLYLREGAEDRVFRIDWLPAIIGRADKKLADNELVAVNLESAATGLRVSRRHVRLSEEGGIYYVESLSNNPTTLVRTGERKTLSRGVKAPIETSDTISLDRSEILLNVLIHEPKDDGLLMASEFIAGEDGALDQPDPNIDPAAA